MTRILQALGLVLILLGALTMMVAGQAVGGRPGSMPPPPLAGQTPQRPPGTGAISGVISDGQTGRPIAGDLPKSDSFFLNVSKAGYIDGRYGVPGPVSGGVASGLVKLGRGEWFRAANIPMFRPGVIAGTVFDEAGEPVVGAFVRVLPQVHVAGVSQIAAGAAVRTDDHGRYRIPGLSSGSYLINVPSVQTAAPRDTRAASGSIALALAISAHRLHAPSDQRRLRACRPPAGKL